MKEYFSSLFIKDSNRTISSFLAHNYIYESPFGNTLFMYPSIKAKHANVNFAVHPNFVDEMMELAQIYRVRVNSIEDIDSKTIKFSFELCNEIAIKSKTKIIWTSTNKHMDYVRNIYFEDFGT